VTRREYIRRQKEVPGRRALGVFPAVYPRELLWAFDILPVEIWDPPLELTAAQAHLQPHVCSVVQLGLELILQGKAEPVDGFLFPHTCDSIQNLASLVSDCLQPGQPCYFLYLPKEPFAASARIYYRAQLKALAGSLEGQFGRLDEDKLREAIRTGRRLNTLLNRLYRDLAAGRLDCGGAEFYRLVRLGEYLWPDDLALEYEALLARPPRAAPAGRAAVVLSGLLPNPPELLELLDRLGLRVTGDDLLCCGRRLAGRVEEEEPPPDDPWAALAEAFFRLPPCSTRASATAERLKRLLELVRAGQARGVIFCPIKFCEPELFDLPILTAELKARGVPTLVLDLEVNQGLSGQLRTRVEAFAEMLA